MDTFLRLRRKFNFHKIKLTYRSLGRMAMYIIGLFILASFIWINFFPSSSDNYFESLASQNFSQFESEITEKLKKEPDNATLWRTYVNLRASLEKGKLNQTKPELGLSFSNPLENQLKTLLSLEEFLKFLKTSTSPGYKALLLRFDTIFHSGSKKAGNYHNLSVIELKEVGSVLMGLRRFQTALQVFNIIRDQKGTDSETKKNIFICLSVLNKNDDIKELLKDSEWRKFADHYTQYKYYLNSGNYGKMLYHLTISEYKHYSWKAYIACAVTGLGWILFLVHLGSGWFWKRKEKLLIILAITLGFFSTIFCLGVVVVQDHFLEHTRSSFNAGNIIYNLGYCILGIGLREEVCKLLFFLPVLFFIKNIREDYKILCYCSLVGLGFSIEENIGYFSGAKDPTIIARFLTANFAHTFLTGFACFYLVKAVQQGGKYWDEFTMTLLKMIVIHGVYDFFILDPTMAAKGFGFFSMMIYVYLAMLYFRLLISTAPPAHQYVSLTRIFTITLSCTIGVTFLLLSSELGFKLTLKVIFAGVLGNAIFAYMFYKEINEPIG